MDVEVPLSASCNLPLSLPSANAAFWVEATRASFMELVAFSITCTFSATLTVASCVLKDIQAVYALINATTNHTIWSGFRFITYPQLFLQICSCLLTRKINLKVLKPVIFHYMC